MEEKIILIYCFCDDFLKSLDIKDNNQSKMNSAEIMTLVIVSALFFGGNFSRAHWLLNNPRYIPNMLSKSRLNRRIHGLDLSIWQSVFYFISQIFSKNNSTLEYLVDSMPVEVCANVRSYRCKILTGKHFIGFCKAKKRFYYGFKIHMITTAAGKPVEFILTPASTADITAFKCMEIDLPSNSRVYGDKAYTSYSFEDYLLEEELIKLIPERKANLSRQHSGCIQYLQSVLRKRIESTFSALVSLFPRKIHAVTYEGFILKLIFIITSFSINQFL